MKAILSLALAIVLSPLAISLFTHDALASDQVEERKVKLVLKADDGEAVKLDLSDLEVGQTTQFTTDTGKLVVATREEDGYLITIDGKEIRVATPEHMDPDGGKHHVLVKVIKDGDGEDGEHEVRVEKRIVVSADGEAIVSGEDGHAVKVIRIGEGDGHGVKVLSDIDCEDGQEEECIERLLSEHGIHLDVDVEDDIQVDEDGVKVIVIKKHEDTEEH